MAAFAGIDKAVPAGGDSLGLGDDEIRALKLFLQEVFGIPDATTITNEAMNIAADGGIVFNDTGADIDFRVEGNNNANMIVMDAGQDALSFGGANVDGAAAIFNNLQQRTFITSIGAQIHVPAQTTDFDNSSGTIAIGAAIFIGIPTVTNANATLTITDPVTLFVGLPVASTNVTFTNLAFAIRTGGPIWIETASAGSITADTDGDDLIIENSGDAGMTILGGTGSNCVINFGDSGDANIGNINYDNSDNRMTFVTNASNKISLSDGTDRFHHLNRATIGNSDAEWEVSDLSSQGGGDVHRAADTTHSSRHMKDLVKYYSRADERKCYDDIKTLKPMRFRYRKGASPHDPSKPGTPNPTGKQHNGYFLDEAPDFIKAAPQVHGIVIDDRIMMLEMAMKEVIRKVEARP